MTADNQKIFADNQKVFQEHCRLSQVRSENCRKALEILHSLKQVLKRRARGTQHRTDLTLADVYLKIIDDLIHRDDE